MVDLPGVVRGIDYAPDVSMDVSAGEQDDDVVLEWRATCETFEGWMKTSGEITLLNGPFEVGWADNGTWDDHWSVTMGKAGDPDPLYDDGLFNGSPSKLTCSKTAAVSPRSTW